MRQSLRGFMDGTLRLNPPPKKVGDRTIGVRWVTPHSIPVWTHVLLQGFQSWRRSVRRTSGDGMGCQRKGGCVNDRCPKDRDMVLQRSPIGETKREDRIFFLLKWLHIKCMVWYFKCGNFRYDVTTKCFKWVNTLSMSDQNLVKTVALFQEVRVNVN